MKPPVASASRWDGRWLRVTAWPVSLLVGLLFLAPILWMLVGSFREDARLFSGALRDWWALSGWTLTNYGDAWRRAALGSALALSFVQVLTIAGVGLVVNTLAAFAFARLHFRGREILFAAVIVLIILPVEVLAVPLFFTVRDLGFTGDSWSVWGGLTLPFFAKAFNIYFLRQHLLNVPVELEEAAALDGAGVWRQFWHVALPSIRPALATVVLIDVLLHWGDFLWPLLLGTRTDTRTIQIGLANLFTQPPLQWGDILACAVIATLPVILIFRWCQRYIVASEARAGIK